VAQKQQGVKMQLAVILPAATVAGRRTNVQIYNIERAKMMSSDKEHGVYVVSGDEHTASRRKFKNSIGKRDFK
jgi:hypothetical protein